MESAQADQLLLAFLRKALAQKRERLCGFASKKKTRPKFFRTLYHALGSYLSPSVLVSELPEKAWSTPALGFITPDDFGVPYASLREAYEDFAGGEGALFITTDARFGIFCDHTFGDAERRVDLRR